MKRILFFSLVLIFSESICQKFEKTPEQIANEKRFEQAKIQFLDGQYKSVLSYYDSLLGVKKHTQFETYKMASESCKGLLLTNPADSLSLKSKSQSIYNEAIKWHGKMYTEERWDSYKIEINKEPEVFTIVDQQPTFPGGMAAFFEYVASNMVYPVEARRMGVEGKVYVQFIVNKDGSVDAVNVVKGIGGACDAEAERVIRNAPNFIPGSQRGESVYVRMVLPIIFKLSAPKPAKKKRNSNKYLK